jgi:hypothetical protein
MAVTGLRNIGVSVLVNQDKEKGVQEHRQQRFSQLY